MADNENKIDPVDRKPMTPADRVRQYQKLLEQQALQTPQAPQVPARKTLETPAAKPTQASQIGNAYVGEVRQVDGSQLNGARPVGEGMGVIGARQANESNLWGGGKPTEIEIVGNPWKIIPFSTAAERAASLAPQKGQKLEGISRQAATFGDLTFIKATFQEAGSRRAAEPRVLVLDRSGAPVGAECKSPEEMRAMLDRLPSVTRQLACDAFGIEADKLQAKLADVAFVPFSTAFDLTFTRENGDKAELRVNKFGLPQGKLSALDLERIIKHVDTFEIG